MTLEIGLEREIKRELKTHLKGASFLGLSGFPTRRYVLGWEYVMINWEGIWNKLGKGDGCSGRVEG